MDNFLYSKIGAAKCSVFNRFGAHKTTEAAGKSQLLLSVIASMIGD